MIPQRATAARKSLRLVVGLWLAVVGWSQARCETYAVLSVMGDHLTVIGMGAQLGSHIDQNRHQTLAVTGTPFDDYAVRVADAAISKARPAASVVALRADDPALYKLRDSWIESDTVGVKELMSFLPESIAGAPDAWLLLIAPYRDELDLKTAFDRRGAGKAAGLGFYVDTITRIRRSDTMESVPGYLGVFAHFQLLLVKLQSGATAAHERVVLGRVYAAARAEDRSAWNALSEADKPKALQALIKQGIEKSLPSMLESARP